MSQLPQEAQGAAIAVLIYSFICLFCNILMLWLLWKSRQIFSHIGCICIATLVSVTANISQQIYINLFWVNVMTDRHNHIKSDPYNPMTAYSTGLTGVEFYLWIFRVASENTAAVLGCCWALSLAQAVYGFANNADWPLINRWGKAIAIVLPLVNFALILTPWVQKSTIAFFCLIAILYFGSIAGGATGLLLILIKYIITRRELKRWEVTTHVDGRTTWRSFRLEDDETGGAASASASHSTGFYDRWLITRFSVAFAFMCIFEMDSAVIEITDRNSVLTEAARPEPNLTASYARETIALFIPSAFASLLTLMTFGTTKHFRNIIYSTFVPRAWQKHPDTENDSTGIESQPTVFSAGGAMNSYRGSLGRRFTDRGSWAAGVRLNGNIALQDLPGAGAFRESTGDRIGLAITSLQDRTSVITNNSSPAGGATNWPFLSPNEIHRPPPVMARKTTYPI